jgi:hypothetical protein
MGIAVHHASGYSCRRSAAHARAAVMSRGMGSRGAIQTGTATPNRTRVDDKTEAGEMSLNCLRKCGKICPSQPVQIHDPLTQN